MLAVAVLELCIYTETALCLCSDECNRYTGEAYISVCAPVATATEEALGAYVVEVELTCCGSIAGKYVLSLVGCEYLTCYTQCAECVVELVVSSSVDQLVGSIVYCVACHTDCLGLVKCLLQKCGVGVGVLQSLEGILQRGGSGSYSGSIIRAEHVLGRSESICESPVHRIGRRERYTLCIGDRLLEVFLHLSHIYVRAEILQCEVVNHNPVVWHNALILSHTESQSTVCNGSLDGLVLVVAVEESGRSLVCAIGNKLARTLSVAVAIGHERVEVETCNACIL